MEGEVQEKELDIHDVEEGEVESSDTCVDKTMLLEDVKEIIGNTSDSSVYIGIFANNIIKENKGVVTGDNAQIEDLHFLNQNNEKREQANYSSECKFGFTTIADLHKWIQAHFGKYELAELISLAVFYDMPYLWIHTNAKALFHKLGWDLKQEEEIVVAKENMLSEFGAFSYKGYIVANGGKTETEFVTFEDISMAKAVLEYMWEQYIDIRISLVLWNELYAFKANYSQSRAAIRAMAVWAQCDYGYFEAKILSGLIRKDTIVAVAEMMSILAKNEDLQENVRKKTIHWGTLQSYEYVMLALMIAQKNEWDVEKIIENYFKQLMWEVENRKKWEFTSHITLMYAVGRRKASYYKTIVKTVASYSERGRYWVQTRKNLALVFYMLFESDMELLRICRDDEVELILVRMLFINNEYAEPLRNLWVNAMRNNMVGPELRKTMKKYWENEMARNSQSENMMQGFYRKVLGN